MCWRAELLHELAIISKGLLHHGYLLDLAHQGVDGLTRCCCRYCGTFGCLGEERNFSVAAGLVPEVLTLSVET